MLLQLTVRNFALIEKTEIRFGPNFNVLSGETGVGKSILIDAVKLLLGGRASAYDIRYGTDAALVEGVFDWPEDADFQAVVEEFGLQRDAGDPLILSRELRSNGRNTCRVNARVLTLNQYRRLSQPLISIFGQHDHQHMSDPKKQLQILDRFNEKVIQPRRELVQAAYLSAQRSGRRYKKLVQQKHKDETEMASLQKELDALLPHQLTLGEEQELRERFHRLAHVDTVDQQLSEAHHALYGAENSAYSLTASAAQGIQRVASLHDGIQPLEERLNALQIQLQELSYDIEAFRNALPVDSGELERIEDRLALFDRLNRRYHKNSDDLVNWIAEAEERIRSYGELDMNITAFQTQYVEERQAYQDEALALRACRQEAADALQAAILNELKDLAMEKARFAIRFDDIAGDATGMDRVTFLFSTNPGMPLMPVSEIASGGEMSRIMLALQTVLGKENDSTLIFDEIDTGIGGMVLGRVAEKLALVANQHQVICVTHAPAIAALADDLFAVEKLVEGESTRTAVTHMTDEATIRRELARMLGGYDAWHLDHADQLRGKRRNNKNR